MFGSLVVVFPTMHEGGALSLRPDGEDETVLDCGEWLRNSEIPSVAYVSFFSDVKHEVYQVEKGLSHRQLPCPSKPFTYFLRRLSRNTHL